MISALSERFAEVATLLVHDAPIPERWRDHALTGDWVGHRDLHVKPDLVLIYAKCEMPDGTRILSLVRLGSHSELGIG